MKRKEIENIIQKQMASPEGITLFYEEHIP